jgi:hypothetical protein
VVGAAKAAAGFGGEEESSLFLPFVFTSLINVMRVFGG